MFGVAGEDETGREKSLRRIELVDQGQEDEAAQIPRSLKGGGS